MDWYAMLANYIFASAHRSPIGVQRRSSPELMSMADRELIPSWSLQFEFCHSKTLSQQLGLF